jgi:dethiobiotin synthetase
VTLVIVGTGTDTGKTVVAAVVLARYGAALPLAYWKPVATGASDGRDAATIEALAGDRVEVLPETYLFPEPLSPHLAARLAGACIDPARLLADFDRHRAAADGRALVIETAGGLLVPLVEGGGAPGRSAAAGRLGAKSRLIAASRIEAAKRADAAPAGYLQADLLADMARRAELACLVVSHSGLGTINHTLLTLEALRARGLAIAGVALDGPPNRENRLAIERFGGVAAVFELPHLAPLDREEIAAAARYFDREGRLARHLQAAAGLAAGIPASVSGSGSGSGSGSVAAGAAAPRKDPRP